MLLSTLGHEEIRDKAEEIVKEFVNSSKPFGLTQKYIKQLNNRKVKDDTILGIHTYTIQNSTVYVVAQKKNYNRSSRSMGEIVFTYYISALNPYTGKYSYIMPTFGTTGYRVMGCVIFTAHFIQRLRERDGKGFADLLKINGGEVMAFVYNPKGTEGEIETRWGTYRLFGHQDGPYITITTMVTEDMLYEDQLPTDSAITKMEESLQTFRKNIILSA